MTETSNLAPNPMIVARRMADGAVLIDVNTGNCFELNRIGTEIWDRLCRKESAEQIIEALTARYAADQASIASDVRRLIEELASSSILVANR